MKNGKLIAVSAVSTALGVVFMVIGAYFQTFDLSALFMASLTVTLPLSKNSVKGSILTYLATAILSFLFATSRFYLPLLYLLFFGIHPILNYFQFKDGNNRWYFFIIKGVLFVGACYLMCFVFSMFTFENQFVIDILPILVFVLGTLFYIVYDFVIIRFQKMSNSIIKRLGL